MIVPEQWPRIKKLVDDALRCETGKRALLLDQACMDDEQVRREVESLVAAFRAAEPVSRVLSSPGPQDLPGDPATPCTIGPYRLERELGSGGMGQVWLAEQTEPVRRHVALKLIRADFRDPEVARRFLYERQSLALMNHPAIAKVFDAGTTDSGQPYLVMQYVEGCSITEYCDRRRLGVEERLRLFELVCEGVQHAHQKAIIHRDLKPSNILVTETDGRALPQIIDFGVAKSIARGFDAKAAFTRVGSVVGTLGYMSPEQADGECEDVDTRSDVYSLGIVLYELLAGALPLDPERSSYYQALRWLREEQALRPSSRLRAHSRRTEIAHARGTLPQALARQLRGDLDSITLKALEKERNLRYGSPAELAADVRRYLMNQPVSARAAGSLYVARKYVRRHRVAVLPAVAAVLLLVGFTVAQTIQLRNTRRQRDRADRITAFMTDMYKAPDPSEARGNTITAREILDQSSRQIESGLHLDSTVQAQLMQVMAQTYTGLGLYDRAADLARRALEVRRRSLGPHDPKALESMTQMAEILERQGREVEAEALMRRTIDLDARLLGEDHPLTLQTRHDLAWSLAAHAHYIEAEKMERAIVPLETRTLGPDDPQTLTSLNTLAQVLKGESRFEEAAELLRGALEREREVLGPDHPLSLKTLQSLADLRDAQSRHDEAETLYREELNIERRVWGPEHPETAAALADMATTIANNPNRQREAEALYRQALDIDLRALGPDHGYTTRAKEGLANVLSTDRRFQEAQDLYQQVLASRLRTLGPDSTDTLLTRYNLSFTLFDERRYAEAEGLLRTTLASQRRVLDADDPDTLATEAHLARVLVEEEKPQEAERLARQAYLVQVKKLGIEHDDTRDSLRYLSRALVRLGRYSEAQKLYLTTLDQAAVQKKQPSAWWYDLAETTAFADRSSDAITYLEHAVQAGYDDAESLRTDPCMKRLRRDPRYLQTLVAAEKNRTGKPALE